MTPIRLNKYLRDHGYASRREADQLIADGKVYINGTLATLGTSVSEGDHVEVRGASKSYEYRAYYKPRGLPTQSDIELDVVSRMRTRGLYPIGRLDKESEGLLILTNDGRLTTKLIGDGAEVEKEYEVTVREPLKNDVPKIFAKGMETEPFGALKPAVAEIVDTNTIRITLVEGKKHQIRVMLAELGYTTTSLMRLRMGPVTLDGLEPGEDRPLTKTELSELGV